MRNVENVKVHERCNKSHVAALNITDAKKTRMLSKLEDLSTARPSSRIIKLDVNLDDHFEICGKDAGDAYQRSRKRERLSLGNFYNVSSLSG